MIIFVFETMFSSHTHFHIVSVLKAPDEDNFYNNPKRTKQIIIISHTNYISTPIEINTEGKKGLFNYDGSL